MYSLHILILSLCFIASYGKPTAELIPAQNIIVEGDILLLHDSEMGKLAGLDFEKYSFSRWPNNTVPYKITDDFNDDQKKSIVTAMKDIEELSCIKFKEHTDEKDYIEVFSKEGCYSLLGRQGGNQTLSLQINGCLYRGIIIHEFLHALGAIHEHVRPDRDQFVEIFWQNIPADWQAQYNLTSKEDIKPFSEYDYGSVMHYDLLDPTRKTNNQAMATKKPAGFATVGQRKGLSFLDIMGLNKMYGCPAPSFLKVLVYLVKTNLQK